MPETNLPMMIIRKRLSAAETQPTNTRYSTDCECVQTTPDGGVTWVDNPAADPRHADPFRLPGRTGGDPRCDAAESMMQHFKAQVDAFLASASILSFVNSALAITSLFFPEIALFTVPLFVVGEALLTIGAITIAEAMTSGVYDQIKCILYCNIDDNGQMSAAGLAAAQSDVDDQIGGTPNIIFDLFAGLWGEVEWSNAGASGEYTGDCADCECLSCDNCSIPTAAFWTQPACVGGVGADYLEFTAEGMFSSLSLPNAQGAIADLNDFVAPGSTGWVVCYQTTLGISMIEATAAESINPADATCYLGSTTNLTLFPDNPVVVPSSQPIVFLAWFADDNGITGLCVTAT